MPLPRVSAGLVVSVSEHLKRMAKKSLAIRREFYPSKEEENCTPNSFKDPLLEEKYEKVKGLIHKYPGRVLVLLTMKCASYCRFCTRRRIVSSVGGELVTRSDICEMGAYLLAHPEINEVIFSGGDPLTSPDLLKYSLRKFSRLSQIKILRIHTRVPVSNPKLLTEDVLEVIKKVNKDKPVYVSIHFEHPDELTRATVLAVKKLRAAGAILLSQSVFLKGINDNYQVLYTLFRKISELGVRPYYLYRCDPVHGAEHFIVPLEKEVKIMTQLRANLSGIACPNYVIDAPNGFGKIPVPLDFWEFTKEEFRDFNGKRIFLSY